MSTAVEAEVDQTTYQRMQQEAWQTAMNAEGVGGCAHCPDWRITGAMIDIIRAQHEHREKVHGIPAPESPVTEEAKHLTDREARRRAAVAENRKKYQATKERERVVATKALTSYLREHGPSERKNIMTDVTADTGLKPSTVGSAKDQMRRDGLITKDRHGKTPPWSLTDATN